VEILRRDGRVGAEDRWAERKQHLVARTCPADDGGDAEKSTRRQTSARRAGTACTDHCICGLLACWLTMFRARARIKGM